MENRLYQHYWRLMEGGHTRTAKALDLMLMRPSPSLYRAAAVVGIVWGFIGGVTH